ncbi:MAG: sigma-70 family RNA polymerase sigma factor [Planctomycetes bacterium]|nr:sigma-70 family RNA polymerase sigma factor [Planctomycetota bacterium]
MSGDAPLRWLLAHRAPLLGYLRALLPHDLVEDAFQETFIVVHRKGDAFDAERDAGAWVRGIARNVARQVAAKATRAVRLPPDLLLERIERAAAEAEPGEDDDLAHLATCVERLDAPARELVRQRYHDGRALDELAAGSGKTAGAVQVALSRVRAALATCIEHRRKAAT